MPNQSSSTSSSSTNASTPKPDYAYYKPYGGWHGFMRSYGLKPHDDDDFQEAKDILAGFRKLDEFDANADAEKAEDKRG